MTFKDKIIILILTFLTLGVYPFVVLRGKRNDLKKTELTTLDKVSIDTKKIMEFAGGSENIIGTEYSHTKVKIFFEDKTKVNVEKMRNINGVSGIFVSSKYITIIVGKQAKSLASKL